MKYHYIASQVDGRVVEDDVEAKDPNEVLEIISTRGLRPISIKKDASLSFSGKLALFGGKITTSDKVFLTKYLALMLKVGTDLLKAINILIDDFDNPAMKNVLLEVRRSLEKGQPFYLTFANHPKHFSPIFVNLVKAGEASGNLEKVFSNLSISLGKEQELKNKIKSAMVYPMILLVLSTVMVLFLVTFALPRIASMFEASSDFDVPTFSRIVFALGAFLGSNALFLLPAVAVAAVFSWFFFFKSPMGRKIMFRFIGIMPVVGTLVKKIALERFARTLASLMRSGLPILESLEITADTVGHEELRAGLLRISREGVAKGLTIGDAFKRETTFPKTVSNLISVSEKAGHVEDVLDTLADFYDSEVDVSVKAMVSFIEPVMLLILGLIVGGIALAVIIPVYQLVGQFG